MGQRGKLKIQAYGKQYSFVGYAENAKRSFLLYDSDTKRIIIRGDAASLKFIDNEFLFSSKKFHTENDQLHADFVGADLEETQFHSLNDDEQEQDNVQPNYDQSEVQNFKDEDCELNQEESKHAHTTTDPDQDISIAKLSDEEEDDNMDGDPSLFSTVRPRWIRDINGRLGVAEYLC